MDLPTKYAGANTIWSPVFLNQLIRMGMQDNCFLFHPISEVRLESEIVLWGNCLTLSCLSKKVLIIIVREKYLYMNVKPDANEIQRDQNK